jgi:hypothetical protein
MRTLTLLTLVATTAAAAAGCQSDATAPLGIQSDPRPLAVIPTIATVDGGKFIKLTATVRHEDGSTSTPPDAAWRSSDGTIASVAADGIVQGLRAGRTQIVATWHDSRGSSLLTVLDPVVKKGSPPCLAPLEAGVGSGVPTAGGC